MHLPFLLSIKRNVLGVFFLKRLVKTKVLLIFAARSKKEML